MVAENIRRIEVLLLMLWGLCVIEVGLAANEDGFRGVMIYPTFFLHELRRLLSGWTVPTPGLPH